VATTDDRTTEGPSADRPTGGRVSRRVVAAGLAWSVPAVVVASAAPAMALSGTLPLFQTLAPCVNPTGGCSGRPTGYGFVVRVCGQGTRTAYLYSATITSLELGDLTFGSVEPPFGTAITPGNCTNVFFNAATAIVPPRAFTATISVAWGHTLPIGSDTDHEPAVLTVSVTATAGVCICPR
jgi:hypothetical protein